MASEEEAMAYSRGAVERAMKVEEVILRAIDGKLTWVQAADILGYSLSFAKSAPEGDRPAVRAHRPRLGEPRDRLQGEVVLEEVLVHLGGDLADRPRRADVEASVGGSGWTSMTRVPPRF